MAIGKGDLNQLCADQIIGQMHPIVIATAPRLFESGGIDQSARSYRNARLYGLAMTSSRRHVVAATVTSNTART